MGWINLCNVSWNTMYEYIIESILGFKYLSSDRDKIRIIQLRFVTIFSNESKYFRALEPPNTDSRLQTDRWVRRRLPEAWRGMLMRTIYISFHYFTPGSWLFYHPQVGPAESLPLMESFCNLWSITQIQSKSLSPSLLNFSLLFKLLKILRVKAFREYLRVTQS